MTHTLIVFALIVVAGFIGYWVGRVGFERDAEEIGKRFAASNDSFRIAIAKLAKEHGHSDYMSWSPLSTIRHKLEECDRLHKPLQDQEVQP